jgi:hypothetical protein
MARKKKEYIPKEAQLAFSGVTKEELPKLIKWLKSVGAKEIEVSDDDGDYEGYDPGPYHIVNYKR